MSISRWKYHMKCREGIWGLMHFWRWRPRVSLCQQKYSLNSVFNITNYLHQLCSWADLSCCCQQHSIPLRQKGKEWPHLRFNQFCKTVKDHLGNFHSFQYGFVFGVDSLFGFMFSLIFGHFGSRIGLKVLYGSGTVVSGTCGILFGCLTYIQDSRLFIGLSYILWCKLVDSLMVHISDSKLYFQVDSRCCRGSICLFHCWHTPCHVSKLDCLHCFVFWNFCWFGQHFRYCFYKFEETQYFGT